MKQRRFLPSLGFSWVRVHADVNRMGKVTMSAILFGSISTVADTSELQRTAFNRAFRVHGLDWHWDQHAYRNMLSKSGGRDRISDYADSVDERVDAGAVHATKSRIFQEMLASQPLTPRAGVVDTIRDAKNNGWQVGLVTTTSRENVSAVLDALGPDVRIQDFDVVVDSGAVEKPKPDKAAYSFALQMLGETPTDCVAIEDNVDGVRSAVAAGLVCVAFLNENTTGHDVAGAQRRVDRLDVRELQLLAAGK
jgi:HAD superfamily hydrolase (TIGR01509 family)